MRTSGPSHRRKPGPVTPRPTKSLIALVQSELVRRKRLPKILQAPVGPFKPRGH